MAERRMFAKTIIDSDAFLDMSQSTQLLYFHLSMRADDDGFINNPKKIQRIVGCNDDDLKILCAKKFIIPFESGIVVIKHWKIHNYIAKDRYTETKYKHEKSLLGIDENNSYTTCIQKCIQPVDNPETQVRLGKDRTGEEKEEEPSPSFQPHTVHTPNNATSRIDKLRIAWNYAGLPECRYTVLNFRDFERSDCMRAVSFYTDEEIEKAIQNYAGIVKSAEHEIFPYKGFTTFMAKGVEQFIDKADPWTTKKRRATESEKKTATEYKERGGFEVPEKTCACCGNTWKSSMATCPKCHYEGGDIEEHKQWYFERFGERIGE